ncbi:hypothetical protein LOZ53_003860 [Ophidiomyces ophidiicola]|nr:hypothetical protein LOZ55_000578 [Ophidiomyces ophidiicola]KAI1988692.1 hypothetical protein LOZ53_003860 [Ophidiomyces ophidiicola]KAI1989374.1 hypothetical protein LOZ51_005186 [Ophidiomyces ophidiicola]KAI1990976.1 hypothetical protein LOZ54_002253 [Ophidiomyces ophidiicola]
MSEDRQSLNSNERDGRTGCNHYTDLLIPQEPLAPGAQSQPPTEQAHNQAQAQAQLRECEQDQTSDELSLDTSDKVSATIQAQLADIRIRNATDSSPEYQTPCQESCNAQRQATAEPLGITAVNNAELDRPKAEDLAKIIVATPIPTIILNSDLHIIHLSDSYLAIFEPHKPEYLGRHIASVEPTTVPIPDIKTLLDVIQTVISTHNIQMIPDTGDSGSPLNCKLRVTPIFEANSLLYVILEALNVSSPELRSKIHEHAYATETYRVLVDTVSDYAIFMLDTKGIVTTWNAGAAILKGYSAVEAIGKHFSLFYGEEDRQKDKPGKELVFSLRNGKVEDEGWRYRKNGSKFWANVTITPVYEAGHHIGFVKITRDLTERRTAEARLIAAYEETSKLKNDFLAHMSHEIRTPMNGVLGALSVLNSTDLSEQQRECTEIIENSTSILLQIINDILDYSKLSSGSFSLTTDVFNVEETVDAVIRKYKSSNSEIELKSIIDPSFPRHVRGDPLRFRQVLQHLVDNAVKFTERGYVHVKTKFEEDSDDFLVTVEVIDSGIGVTEEAMSTLFSPFTRSADSTTKRYQGTGLGLSICKSLAELMGGTVGYAVNPDGQGSVFWLKIHLGRIDPPAIRTAIFPSSNPCEDIKKVARSKHLLVVEDNIVNQVILMKMLKTLNFQRIDAAWDGVEAVSLVRKKPLAYDVILMDISMPMMDGLEATRIIRGMKNEAPIIAVTCNTLRENFDSYIAKGMNDYLPKPIHRKDLARALLQWISVPEIDDQKRSLVSRGGQEST